MPDGILAIVLLWYIQRHDVTFDRLAAATN
jgi:hypothetical protein